MNNKQLTAHLMDALIPDAQVNAEALECLRELFKIAIRTAEKMKTIEAKLHAIEEQLRTVVQKHYGATTPKTAMVQLGIQRRTFKRHCRKLRIDPEALISAKDMGRLQLSIEKARRREPPIKIL